MTRKNRAERDTRDATRNIKKLMPNAPPETVKTLYGSGVNPAVKITQKFQSSYRPLINMNRSCVKPGTFSKKNIASDENSFGLLHQAKEPIIYPRIAPKTDAIEQTKANLNARDRLPRTSAISKGSGGMGKKDASANDRSARALVPYGVSAQCRTQS